jgi:outer membrane protein TolC
MGVTRHNRNNLNISPDLTDDKRVMARLDLRRLTCAVGALLLGLSAGGCVPGAGPFAEIVPEQRHLEVRDLEQLPKAHIPPIPPPVTVSNPSPQIIPQEMSLDDAIRIGLANSKVVRILAGTTAVSSGQTIYDPAIVNTTIDQARAAFDPVVTANNTFSQAEDPVAFSDPTNPFNTVIPGTRVDNYQLGLGITKKTVTGGTLGLTVNDTDSRFFGPIPAPLNPQALSGVTLSYTQPLLQGGGIAVNLAPIVVARLNTERSYFQLKDSVQELVRSVTEAYWAIVFARTDVWARRQQVEQGAAAYARSEGRQRAGFTNVAEVAQARASLASFRANLITSEANLLQREAALRNLIGLPPTEPARITPVSPPTPARYDPNWDELIHLAEERRPDLIELKLIIEADQQNLIVAKNQSLPQVNATMLYRWNGLEGTTPIGQQVSTSAGQFNDWSLGVNFSVPLGLRQGRAAMRQAELILVRDRANLDQGVHAALNEVADSVRNLSQFYEQYNAFRESRTAARINLEQQLAENAVGRAIFLNVLQAITDWGNAVSSEAQALAQYNTELARLERVSGTILETHGVRFFEERFSSIGPLGRLAKPVCYPESSPPGPNANRYPVDREAGDAALEKDKPVVPQDKPSATIPLLPPPTKSPSPPAGGGHRCVPWLSRPPTPTLPRKGGGSKATRTAALRSGRACWPGGRGNSRKTSPPPRRMPAPQPPPEPTRPSAISLRSSSN